MMVMVVVMVVMVAVPEGYGFVVNRGESALERVSVERVAHKPACREVRIHGNGPPSAWCSIRMACHPHGAPFPEGKGGGIGCRTGDRLRGGKKAAQILLLKTVWKNVENAFKQL
jgi:hypothetical protein